MKSLWRERMPVYLGKRSFPARHLHHVVISHTELDPIRHSQPGPILLKTTRSVMPNSVSTRQSERRQCGICTALAHSTGQTMHVKYPLVRATPCWRERLPYAGGALARQSVLGQTHSAVHQCLPQERKHRQPSCLPDDVVPRVSV